MSTTIALVTPVLDDWGSLATLLGDISAALAGFEILVHVYAVDDGSSAELDPADIVLPSGSCVVSLEIIRLAANLGHQRAISVGLCAVVEDNAADAVLVMDSDGQDRPADLAALLAASGRHPRHVVLAARAKRAEALGFRICYRLYRLIFRALTGNAINFGNYSLIPMSAARRLVRMPDLWNNLVASLMRSRLPYLAVPTVRGRRLSGRSKMNLAALMVHALSAMSVYSELIFVRVLLAAGGVAALAGVGIAGVTVVRTATELAIPGWATTAAGDLLIILLQTVVVAIAASLRMLAGRRSRPIMPIVDYAAFVAERQRCRLDQRRPAIVWSRPTG